MNNVKNYLIHLLVLCIFQVVILDNVHLGSYFYINIYMLAVYLLPYRIKGVPLLLFGFALGMVMDLADNTIGIHAAASTFVAYIRPRLLQLTTSRESFDESHAIKLKDFSWFFKYTFLSTLLFNVVLIMAEAFTFTNFFISLLRIILSTFISELFILLYYFIGLKNIGKKG